MTTNKQQIAITASQTRLIANLERFYGENAMNNAVLAEYKRVTEAFEKETRENMVRKEKKKKT